MATPSHRPSASVSPANLAAPAASAQRRMSLPPPPAPLNLPEPVAGHSNRRPPSPLRNGFAIDPRTGELTDAVSDDAHNHDQWGQRSISPTPSVSKFASDFAQRVGSLMSNMSGARSPGLPTDEELEAEAEREREHSRREAERILAREAEERERERERQTVEQRVMAMLQQAHADVDNLRPPPTRSQTMSATPPSPSSSQKDGNWWTMAKQKLTPTKEPLTPAQQIIQDTKQREKEAEKEKKKAEKDQKRQRSKEWPSTPEKKHDDPAFIKLGMSASPGRHTSAAPASPSPNPRGIGYSNPPSLAASPMRGLESDAEGGMSPSRSAPPLYAQFNSQGALDVSGTLLTIARRFEKLEKWTVSHVRALEDRMDDVERWLVDKEHEKEEQSHAGGANGDASGALGEIREEMAELQGRIGELGREMAKMVTAPGNLSSGPGRNAATLARAPSTSSSIAVQSISKALTSPPRATPPRTSGATSPPMSTPIPSNRNSGSRTRLPYPTGDYASPPDSTFIGQGPFSPSSSPPASLNAATKGRQLSISGLPAPEADAFSPGTSPSALPSSKPPSAAASPSNLPAPNAPAWRPSSASPTPRKRYTVALGTQIMPRSTERDDSSTSSRPTTPHTHSRSHSRASNDLGTAFFSASPKSAHSDLFGDSGQSADESGPDGGDDDDGEDDDGAGEETIGRTAGRHVSISSSRGPLYPPHDAPTNAKFAGAGLGIGVGPGARRARPQSMYAAPTSSSALMAPSSNSYSNPISAPAPITPLNVRLRSRSTDRFSVLEPPTPSTPGTGTGKFVDPLVARREATKAGSGTQTAKALAGAGKKKVPVGDLVAFFDQGK